MNTNQATHFTQGEILETQLDVSLSPQQAIDLIVMLTAGISHNGLNENVTLRIEHRKHFNAVLDNGIHADTTAPYVEFSDNFLRQVGAEVKYISAVTTGEGE